MDDAYGKRKAEFVDLFSLSHFRSDSESLEAKKIKARKTRDLLVPNPSSPDSRRHTHSGL